MHELASDERIVAVNRFDHHAQGTSVPVVPKLEKSIGRGIGGGMNRAYFGTDDGPSALSADLTNPVLRVDVLVTSPGAVRHLIEAVLGRHRTDAHRLEQNVVAWIANHSDILQN